MIHFYILIAELVVGTPQVFHDILRSAKVFAVAFVVMLGLVGRAIVVSVFAEVYLAGQELFL